MLTITRVDHIAQAVPEVEPQLELLESAFGFLPRSMRDSEQHGYHGRLLDPPGATGIAWEVLAPASDSSPLAPFGERPGLHHITLEVPDVEEAQRELAEAGIQPVDGGDGWFDARIDPDTPPQGLIFRIQGAGATEPCVGFNGGWPVGTSAKGEPLGITAIDHICHAYRDRDELARFYERTLGFREVFRTPDGEHEDLADLVMDVPGTTLKWEVIQPVGEGSFIEKFLSSRGPAPHHVTFQVRDWERALAASEQHEIPMFDENQGETDGARWRDAFIHPRHTGGMLVQLFWEERPGVWVRSDKVPSAANA